MCDVLFVGKNLSGEALKDLTRRVKDAGMVAGDWDVYSFPELSAGEANRARVKLAGRKANVLVPLGEEALQLITSETGIREHRGSVLSIVVGGRPRKVIPSYHPTEIWSWWVPSDITSKFDMKKIREQSKFREVTKTERKIYVPSNRLEVERWADYLADQDKLSVDIECTIKTHNLICVGFGTSANMAVVFGAASHMFTDGQDGALASHKAVTRLLESKSKKVLQNGNFDMTFLLRKGFPFEGFYFDTMYAHHLLHVELPRSLAYLTSVYTDQPYFKDMVSHAKSEGQMDWQVMARYNGLDCCTTYEVGEVLEQQVRDAGLWDFFQLHYVRLLEPLMEAQLDGVRIDVESKEKLKVELAGELAGLDEELGGMLAEGWMPSKEVKRKQECLDKMLGMVEAGKHRKKDGEIATRYLKWKEKYRNFHVEINFGSPVQVAEMLYGMLKIPKRTKDGKVTTDDTAIQKIIRSRTVSGEGKLFCSKLLERRGLVKLIGTYLECPLDADDRMRCTYNVARTKTGRLSSEGNIFGTGTNLQNIPKRKGRGGVIRSLFLPDEGDVFVAADYGQAEARVVGYASEEKGFIDCFEEGRDLFKVVAGRCFGVPELEVEKPQRNIAKVVVHGGNYGMALGTLAFNLGMTEDEAGPIKFAYDKAFYRLQEWRDETKDQIDLTRKLTTPLGRYRVFYDRVKTIIRNSDRTLVTRWNDNYLRDAFSYYPQSTVGDLLNEALVRTWDMIHKQKWYKHRPRFRLQVHDEVVFSVNQAGVNQLKKILAEAMNIPLTINGTTFTIPIDTASGTDWSTLD